MKFRAILSAALVAGALGIVPAQADHAACGVTETSADHPQLLDGAGDYAGIVFGNGNGLPPGGVWADVYQGDVDLLSARLEQGADGKVRAHIKLASLSGTATQAIYYLLWTYDQDPNDPADDVRNRRYVSVTIPRPGTPPVAEYGYLDESGAVGFFTTQGSISGATADLANAEFSFVVPLNRMGNPSVGAVLENIRAEARIFTGARGTGLLSLVDNTDLDPCDVAYL